MWLPFQVVQISIWFAQNADSMAKHNLNHSQKDETRNETPIKFDCAQSTKKQTALDGFLIRSAPFFDHNSLLQKSCWIFCLDFFTSMSNFSCRRSEKRLPYHHLLRYHTVKREKCSVSKEFGYFQDERGRSGENGWHSDCNVFRV